MLRSRCVLIGYGIPENSEMQPDIEIYLKECTPEQAGKWLAQVFEQCTEWQPLGQVLRCRCDGIRVAWYGRVAGSWSSLLFDSSRTPWANDLECAQAAYAALGVEVRCAPGGWQEEQGENGADDWLRVDADGVSQVVWRI